MYKEKYEQALSFIKYLQKEKQMESEEKEKISIPLIEPNINSLCENLFANKRDSLAFYEAIDSPLAKIFDFDSTLNQNLEELKLNEFKISENIEVKNVPSETTKNFDILNHIKNFEKNENDKLNEIIIKSKSKLTLEANHPISKQDHIITKAYKARKIQMLEKLKEEYHNLVEDKKNLELKITEFNQKEKQFAEINIKNENLNIQLEIANEKIKSLTEENKTILERNNKITFENYEITNTNNQLKESLKYLEKERLLNKNKINCNFNKVKLYEKENNASKKKLNSLNTNLKNLTAKLNTTVQEKMILEKKIEDLKQEYENKITNLMLEQQKIIKDSFLSTLNSLEEKKIPLEFFYEEEKNSLTIMLEDIVISEFTNLKMSKIDKTGKIEELKTAEINSPKKSNSTNQSVINNIIKPENNDAIKSPSNRSSLMNINNKNIFNNNLNVSGSNQKNNKIDLENLLSLNKILSGSSKKSFTNTNTKRILMSNFSSAKKISAFNEDNNNNNICSAFYNSTAPVEPFGSSATNLSVNKNMNFDLQNLSNYMTNNLNNFVSTNCGSSMKVLSEEIDPKIYVSSIQEFKNLNDAYIQDSNYSKIVNLTVNKNNESNASHYENDRYSGMNFSAKKKSRVSQMMSGKKNNINFIIDENDENFDPNFQSQLQKQNSIIKKKNSNKNTYCSILKDADKTSFGQSDKKKENGNVFSNKINGRRNNMSLAGIKASNNNNFEKCIKNININTEQINSINRDDIKKLINTASSTRHRKMISLDEALNQEETCIKEILDNEIGVNHGSYHANDMIQTKSDSNYFNSFSIQLNQKFKNHHFNFDYEQVDTYLRKPITPGHNFIDLEYSKQIKGNKSNEPNKDIVSKKIEFDNEKDFENIPSKRGGNNIIENVITDLFIKTPNRIQTKDNIDELKSQKKLFQGFIIDSNVNLITISSLKKSGNIMITSENNFDLISNKTTKFLSESLKLFQNENMNISQTLNKTEKEEFKKMKENIERLDKNQLLIVTKENFFLKQEEKIHLENENLNKELTNSDKKSHAHKNLEVANGYDKCFLYKLFNI